MNSQTTDLISLEVLDVDGAIREADDAVAGDTRASFFRKAAIGGGSLIAGGVLMGGLPSIASAAPSKAQDVKILNFALTLEYLEAAFYDEAVKNGALTGEVLDTTKTVQVHERNHVKAIKAALGSAAVAKPRFDFGDTTSDPKKYLATAVALEDTGVRAYGGQAGRIFQAPVLKAAVSILIVEARHASRFRSLNGQSFAPGNFANVDTMGTILKAVGDTGFIQS